MIKNNSDLEKLVNHELERSKENFDIEEWWYSLSEDWKDVFRNELNKMLRLGNLHESPYPEKEYLDTVILLKNIETYPFQPLTLSPLHQLKELSSLNVMLGKINSLTEIEYLTEIEHLNLAHNYINDLSPLRKMKNIKTMDFYNNNIHGLKSLKYMKNLISLDFSKNFINSLKDLENMKNLRNIDISGNPISVEEINRFKRIHPYCKVITI